MMMIMLHKRTALVYYYPEDIKSMELTNALDEYKTKLILRIAGIRETVYVKETPAQILNQIAKMKEKKK